MGAASSSVRRPPRDLEKLNLYEVLEIDENATKEEIKKAYYKQSREHHPDKNLNDDGATKRFTRVLEAYQTLMDDEKRAVYDYTRSQQENAEARPPSPFSQDVPGSFSAPSGPKPRTSNPLGGLGAILGGLLSALAWLFSWWKPRPRFVYKDYLAKSRARGFKEEPGISIRDIVDFLKSLPKGEGFDMEEDHDDDLQGSLFAIFDDFFRCLALDELRWGAKNTFPRFGSAHYVWSRADWEWDPRFAGFARGKCEVQDFYAVWSRFETSKTFEWVAPTNRNAPRSIRKRNKEVANRARQAYNALIQVGLSIFLRFPAMFMTVRREL
ncbi:putative ATP-dependent protein binding [Lyophyllum shimeji]|uniref:ATP-dependent protein binding n=1 Tax=Lyophyllum shimeji TaxID=47721 RepID=A0A9P3PLH6_LYOSH|nr:putative ATP-dependent protein binding [Lyophyllum shimeji]